MQVAAMEVWSSSLPTPPSVHRSLLLLSALSAQHPTDFLLSALAFVSQHLVYTPPHSSRSCQPGPVTPTTIAPFPSRVSVWALSQAHS